MTQKEIEQIIVKEVVAFVRDCYTSANIEQEAGNAYNNFFKTSRHKRLLKLMEKEFDIQDWMRDEHSYDVEYFYEEVVADTIDTIVIKLKERKSANQLKALTPLPQPQKNLQTIQQPKQEPKNHKALAVDDSIEVEAEIPPFVGIEGVMRVVKKLQSKFNMKVKKTNGMVDIIFMEKDAQFLNLFFKNCGFSVVPSKNNAYFIESLAKEKYFSKYGIEV